VSTRLGDLHPDVEWAARVVLSWAAYYGIPVRVVSTYRTCFEQAVLYTNWLQRQPGALPANRPGDSSHNYGLGWDSVVDPGWQAAWNYLRSFYFRVPSNDQNHAEVPGWRQYVLRDPCA
jgi:hypothetical protein